ncbi:MAG: rhodanese-like domain-containing protein [Thermoanaerobaculia bacterium]
MIDRRFFAELFALIAAAVLCAAVANAFASKERKLAWSSDYPNARVIPQFWTAVPETGELPGPVAEPEVADAPAAAEPATATDVAAPVASSTAPARPVADPPRPAAAAAKPAQLPPPTKTWSLADFPSSPDQPALNASFEQVVALHGLGATFIDARRSQAYEQGHIAGSLSLPVWESDIDERIAAFYSAGYDPEAPLVIYCSGGECEDSHMLAQKLWGIGYNNIRIYPAGWPEWSGKGLPLARGRAQ